jgi:carboxypeptidase C (cathepsin A)
VTGIVKNNNLIAVLACVLIAQSLAGIPASSKLKHEQTPHLTAQEQDESAAKDAQNSQQDEAKEPKALKPGDKKNTQSDSSDSKKSKEKEEEPKPSIVEHTVIIDGKPVRYKSVAGYMVLKDYDNKAKKDSSSDDKDQATAPKEKTDKSKDKNKEPKALAKIFYIAYVREDAGTTKRPITFSFNGGPGSASIWLHMGALGPRRAVLTDRGEALPPPYRLEDNNYSWLDQTDLVFIDPVSTGYSRVEPDEDPKKYHGYDEDINSIGEFIRLYLTKYNRWTSPKFVIGESYGTTRAAGLSDFLQNRYGIYLNGIILVSAVLNFQTLDFSPGNELPFELYMPSYTAAAWYHKKLAPELLNKRLTDVLSEAEDFASHDYRTALFEGDKLSPEKKQEIADRLSQFIGLPPNYISQLGDEVPFDLFATHLLMEQNRQIGRYDSRYTGMRYNPGRDDMEFDPSFEAVNGPFTATFNDYARRELHFESELPYETLANVWPWKYQRAQNRYLNVAEDLRKAMIRNPYLKVWLCCGYYDLATPYFASKYTVDQMSLEAPIHKNIRLTYYNSGHMLYVLKPALIQFKSDFRSFLNDALLPDSSVVPTAER